MKRFVLAALPAAALLATPAWSQQQQTPQDQPDPSIEERLNQAGEEVEEKAREAGEAAERAVGAEEPAATITTTAAEPIIVLQEQGQLLADKIIGAPVKAGPGEDAEEIGTVEDLLFDRDNDLVAAVVGVGGFLGIGTKRVAVSWDALEKVETDDDVSFIVSLSREQLEQAPDFMTVEDQRKQEERQQRELQQQQERPSPISPAPTPRPAN